MYCMSIYVSVYMGSECECVYVCECAVSVSKHVSMFCEIREYPYVSMCVSMHVSMCSVYR